MNLAWLDMGRQNWSRRELIAAFNLYCRIPFGKIHNRNPQIIELASLLRRSPSSVSWKLANFSRLDPTLKKRGITGAQHGSKAEQQVWDEFNDNWDELCFASEKILNELKGESFEAEPRVAPDFSKEGKERLSIARVRVNQQFFRATILASYNSTCCVTGLQAPELLIASHIKPWADDPKNRVNPMNGLCLNALHDKAFDRGLITITADFRVKLSPAIKDSGSNQAIAKYFLEYENIAVRLPDKFVPNGDFFEYHNRYIFKEK